MTPSIPELSEEFSRLFPSAVPAEEPTATPAVPAEGAAPTPPTPAPLAMPPPPIQILDHAVRGYHLEVRVAPDQVVRAATLLDQHGFALDTIAGVDWMAESQMEVVYDYFHPETNLRVAVRTQIPRGNPEVPTIYTVFPGANWHERETHDFFGIRFLGHPDLTPILLPEDADYHPLKKDFVA